MCFGGVIVLLYKLFLSYFTLVSVATFKTVTSVFTLMFSNYFQLDRDGLHDLNVQGDWQKKNGTYWVRYVHVELLGHDSYGKKALKTKRGFCLCFVFVFVFLF